MKDYRYEEQMGSWLSDITGINVEGPEVSLEDLAKGGVPGVAQTVVTSALKSTDVQTTAKAAGLEALFKNMASSITLHPIRWALIGLGVVVGGVYISKKLF